MNIDKWLDNICSVSSPKMSPQAKTAAAELQDGSGDDYVRIGRRTVEDEDGDIRTEYIVVARIDATKQKVCWLSVATWQFNGLRVGSLDAGDRIREDDESFSLTTGLDPDPYFFARNILSPQRIREHLLELLSRENVRVLPETYDDHMAQVERNHAQWARMVQDHGPQVASTRGVRTVAGQDPKQRFPHPWALPVALTDSWDTSFIGIKPGPTRARRRRAKQEWLPTFDSIGNESKAFPINVIAVFVNDFQNRDLRLTHFVDAAFESNESFESAKDYFLEGDGTGSSEFRGLNHNSYLSQVEWSIELWVLPQVEGCSTLIKWDDVPQLEARALCDWRAIQKSKGASIYIEVRIVEKKSRVASPIESQAGVVSD